MQITYRKQTAAAILKTARIEVMRGGQAEIVVDLASKKNCVASLAHRRARWGGTLQDVLVITDVDGQIARLSTTPRSLAALESLHAECIRVQLALNAMNPKPEAQP